MAEQKGILLTKECVLFYVQDQLNHLDSKKDFDYLKENFCGKIEEITSKSSASNFRSIYLCGNIEENYSKIKSVDDTNLGTEIFVIRELSYNYNELSKEYHLIGQYKVPINIHDQGVYFRNFFDAKDYFNLISQEHKFQSLTESNKNTNAFRTGIYLTKVEESKSQEELSFKLLRCSSNLHGPTDNFRLVDQEIVSQVNHIGKLFFQDPAELNHVLAQIYENKTIITDKKEVQKKAKIKEHSDKTKDMPQNGLIAFCTFYNDDSKDNGSNSSIFTRLRFRLKKAVKDEILQSKFDVILYPHSLFVISLLTNRLYTHEIVPSSLAIEKIPVRMGYVIRCSKRNAIFRDNQTFIKDDQGNYVKLEPETEDQVKRLKLLYAKENLTDEIIEYDNTSFSLNKGDYEKPIL